MQAITEFIFKLEKLEIPVDDLIIPIILQNGRFLLILFFKRILKSNDNLPGSGKTITKFFFSAVNVTGFSVSLLLRKFLSICQFDRKCILFFPSLNGILLNEILKNSKQLKMFEIIR